MLMDEGDPFDELPRVETVWEDPATFAPAAITDAVTKQVTAQIIPADSDVALEQLGYDRSQVERIQSDRRRTRATGVVAGLASIAQNARAIPAVSAQTGATSADSGATPPVPSG